MKLRFAPAWATIGLRKFGCNPYGELQFRAIWGPSRTKILGGYWEDVGKSEYRRTLKYGTDPKWILERWRPPQIYGTPEMWDAQTLTPDGFYGIGPFPSHGEFEMCERFSTARGPSGYVPLEAGLIEMTARAVWMGRINSYSDIRRTLEDECLAKEKQQDRNFDDLWSERQLSRPGLSMGAGGAFNKQAEIDDYARRIERSGAFVDGRRFRPGFRQS